MEYHEEFFNSFQNVFNYRLTKGRSWNDPFRSLMSGGRTAFEA